jgi:hypothetical protein
MGSARGTRPAGPPLLHADRCWYHRDRQHRVRQAGRRSKAWARTRAVDRVSAKWLLVAIATAVVGQLMRELLAVLAGKVGSRLINRAANHLPEKRREIRRQEWLADFEWLTGRGAYVLCWRYIVGAMIGSYQIRRVAHRAQRRSIAGSGSSIRAGLPPFLRERFPLDRKGTTLLLVATVADFAGLTLLLAPATQSLTPTIIGNCLVVCALISLALFIYVTGRRIRNQRDRRPSSSR